MGALQGEFRVSSVKCETCKHIGYGFECKAFEIIPKEIWSEKVEHDTVWDDQKGEFVYEKKPETT